MSTQIPTHPAIRTAREDGRAEYHPTFKGRKSGRRGVVLHERDRGIIGYPILMTSGRYMIPEGFGRIRFSGALGTDFVYLAVGRAASKAEAIAAYEAHPSTRQRLLEAARTDHRYDGSVSGEEIGRRDRDSGYGSVYYHDAETGIVTESRSEYDHPLSVWTIALPAERVRELLAS